MTFICLLLLIVVWVERDVGSFMFQLHDSHIQGLRDLDYDSSRYSQGEDSEEDDNPKVDSLMIPWIHKQATRDMLWFWHDRGGVHDFVDGDGDGYEHDGAWVHV